MLLNKFESYFVRCQNNGLLFSSLDPDNSARPWILHGDTNLAKMLTISHVLICLLQIFKREYLIFISPSVPLVSLGMPNRPCLSQV